MKENNQNILYNSDDLPELWRRDCVAEEGRWKDINSSDLFVWAGVNIETGQVEMETEEFDDQLNELAANWKWMRFRLVPSANDDQDLFNQMDNKRKYAWNEAGEWQRAAVAMNNAIQRGTKIWQHSTGNRDVLPDVAKLVNWLCDRLSMYEKIEFSKEESEN